METTKLPLTAKNVSFYMRVGSPEQIGAVVGYVRCAAQDNSSLGLKMVNYAGK